MQAMAALWRESRSRFRLTLSSGLISFMIALPIFTIIVLSFPPQENI
jgi:hypothetical protein